MFPEREHAEQNVRQRAHQAQPRALPRRLCGPLLLIAMCSAWATPGQAFSSLFEHLARNRTLAALLPDEESRAIVQDGFLFGSATERVTHLADGRLLIKRLRHYTHIRHPKTHVRVALPEPWEFEASLTLEPSLRLVQSDTRLRFKRSADNLFPDYKFSERHAWLFEWDRSVVRVSANGLQLEQQTYLDHKPLGGRRYDYPANAIPVEIIAPYLSVAARWHVDQFDFDLLLPGGDIHGVRSQIHRTQNPEPFAKEYRIPKQRLRADQPLAIVDMRLASPVKYLFFPHHFFIVFSDPEPSKLLMMWGGDPEADLEAFRVD
jgi:hypothetical protein